MTEIANYPCTGCGCVCDDVTLTVEGDRVVAAANACDRGQRFLLSTFAQIVSPTINGQAASIDSAIDVAASLLSAAKLPLITGLSHCTVDGQRAAIALADASGACIDAGGSAERVFPDIGSVTCSLGEMMNRADVVFVWRCRPHETHPRWRERYFRGQWVIAIGEADAAKAIDADEFVPLDEHGEFDALWTLRAAVRGRATPAPWNFIAENMMSARPSVILFGGSGRALEAANGLAADLNEFTRSYVVTLSGPGNPLGATQACTWQTGYSAAVGLHRGYPRFFGSEYSTQRLIQRGETDLVLTIGSAKRTTEHLSQIHIAPESDGLAAVFIPCASFPVGSTGTIFRGDGIALPLPLASPSSRPADFQVLSLIAQRLRTMRGGG